MGKERDKLLWELGKKPNTMTGKEALLDCTSRRIKEGNLPPRMQKVIDTVIQEAKERDI